MRIKILLWVNILLWRKSITLIGCIRKVSRVFISFKVFWFIVSRCFLNHTIIFTKDERVVERHWSRIQLFPLKKPFEARTLANIKEKAKITSSRQGFLYQLHDTDDEKNVIYLFHWLASTQLSKLSTNWKENKQDDTSYF